VPASCVPKDEFDANGGAVADDCGIFVSRSLGDKDSGDGSKAKPFVSFKYAYEAAKAAGKPMYACGEVFDGERVALSGTMSFFGGLDCAGDWTWAEGKKTKIQAPAGVIGMIVDAPNGARVADVIITAANAVQAGDSSIAMLVSGGSLSIERSELIAGSGAKGADGADYDLAEMAELGLSGSSGNWTAFRDCPDRKSTRLNSSH
jgi:hypothetical protein